MAVRRIESKGSFEHIEAIAVEANIKPGMQVLLDSAGKFAIHGTAGGNYGDEIIIVIEDALQGKTVDDAYAINTRCFAVIPHDGAEVNLLIADEQDIAIGDKIIANGSGKFKETTGVPKGMIGVATAANDLTGSNSSDTLSPVRIAR